jgi:3,4-dihydroxy 2-butanone 4-phosphate synthase/GTP cyclohydrolase II
MNKIKAYALQDQGFDTVEANQKLGFPPDLRTYGLGAQMLKDIGVGKFRLLTNNPRKIVGLEGFGLEMVGREPLQVPANPRNAAYMAAKRERLGHLLDQELGDPHGH